MRKFMMLDIVKKMIGSIEPAGAEHIDKHRYENLNEHAGLVEDLLYNVLTIAMMEKQGRASEDRIIDRARVALKDFTGIINNWEE